MKYNYKRGELDEHAARLRGNKNSDEFASLTARISSPFDEATDEKHILYHMIETGCSEAEAWPKLEEIKDDNILPLE